MKPYNCEIYRSHELMTIAHDHLGPVVVIKYMRWNTSGFSEVIGCANSYDRARELVDMRAGKRKKKSRVVR